MKRLVAALACCVAFATACGGNSRVLPPGQYSGSTSAQQAVNVVVGGTITLDGVEMRATSSKWLIAAHDKRLRMRCASAFHKTELVCTIDRHGAVETDELLKL